MAQKAASCHSITYTYTHVVDPDCVMFMSCRRGAVVLTSARGTKDPGSNPARVKVFLGKTVMFLMLFVMKNINISQQIFLNNKCCPCETDSYNPLKEPAYSNIIDSFIATALVVAGALSTAKARPFLKKLKYFVHL
jgi:hypothetical protein